MAGVNPLANSGYGKQSRLLTYLFKKSGHEVNYYTPQVMNSIIQLPDGVTVMGRSFDIDTGDLPVNSFQAALTYFNPDIVLSLWDAWAIGGLVYSTVNRVKWILYTPIDSELDNYTIEMNNVLNAPNVTEIWTPAIYGVNQIRKVVKKEMVDRVFYIPHIVDGNVFKPLPNSTKEKYGLSKYDAVVITVAFNQSERKNLQILIAAMSKAMRKLKDGGVNIAWLFWTNPLPQTGNSFDIMRLLRRYEINDRTYLPTLLPHYMFTSDEQLNELYNASDFYVTATGGEGFNLPIAESIKAGTPVLTTPEGDPDNIISIGDNGEYINGYSICFERLFTPVHTKYCVYDPDDVADSIVLMYDNVRHNAYDRVNVSYTLRDKYTLEEADLKISQALKALEVNSGNEPDNKPGSK